MKKRNWLSLTALALLVTLSFSSCYYGYYGPPRPRGGGGYGHHHGGGGGHHHGGGGRGHHGGHR